MNLLYCMKIEFPILIFFSFFSKYFDEIVSTLYINLNALSFNQEKTDDRVKIKFNKLVNMGF